MKETGLTGKRRSTTIAATPDDGNSQRKRRSGYFGTFILTQPCALCFVVLLLAAPT